MLQTSLSINLGLDSLEYFLEPFLELASKTAQVLKKLGVTICSMKEKKFKENEHQKLKNLKVVSFFIKLKIIFHIFKIIM